MDDKKRNTTEPLIVAGTEIKRGTSVNIDMPLVRLYTDTEINMPIHVRRARKDGPTLFVSAAVHGDEINGIEIIRRIMRLKTLKLTSGTLILAPMVNVYGVLNKSRYMPDRRDLNRSFPGSENGSLAAVVAHRFLTEVVQHCDYGIDLHTGAIHRSNLPQIRANLEDDETTELAKAFGVSVLMNSNLRDGSLREAASDSNTRILLYEAGEALRFDELSIRAGQRGILNVLSTLGMINKPRRRQVATPYIANTSSWVRAHHSGFVRNLRKMGDYVEKGDALAEIGSPMGETLGVVKARRGGIVIGKQNIPLVQKGDAMFHIAYFSEEDEEIAENIQAMSEQLLPSQV
ncbi:MAG: succinylglutamate desuccinylase/aspartoacylase family protein [Arenicella sp.]|nr:succinylglutamate desuccinylase/aspartoacylase family protein [Arenicella sp.]